MTISSRFRFAMTGAVAAAALCAGGGIAEAQFKQTDLVSSVPGLAAILDPTLVNPWGVSFAAGSPIWTSNQGTQTANLYPVMGSTGVGPTFFTVNIPPAGAAGPTGQVANANGSGFGSGFDVGMGGNGAPALFIFANLNGSISAWNGPLSNSTAFTQVTVAGASYTGLAINQAATELFAANDAGAGSIDVFNSSFTQVMGAGFATPTSISMAGLVPFDVKDIGGNVFVTYAPATHAAQTAATPGQGAVAEFTEGGVLEGMSTTSADSEMASPWGIAIAPAGFGPFGGDILVGNFAFGDSVINAFNPMNWDFVGSIAINNGGQMPGGLWSLAFGGSGNDGTPNTLFFTDGLNGETGGLFGAITVPEPSTWAMMLLGFGGLGLLALRQRRSLLALG